MADKRDQIMQALSTALATILTTGGYNSNLGSHVFEWRPKLVTETGANYVPTDKDELPALHVRDVLDEIAAVNLRGDEGHGLNVEIEIAHEASAIPATMRGQINDIREALGVDPTLGGLCAKNSFRTMTAETIRLQGDRSFFRTLLTTKLYFSTSGFAEE